MEQIYIILAAILLAVLLFLRLKENVKEWLLWAVTEAENYLGSGTGKLKLRYVYDQCVEKFPAVKYLLPFSVFSKWVDEALIEMRKQIANNKNIAAYVASGEREN